MYWLYRWMLCGTKSNTLCSGSESALISLPFKILRPDHTKGKTKPLMLYEMSVITKYCLQQSSSFAKPSYTALVFSWIWQLLLVMLWTKTKEKQKKKPWRTHFLSIFCWWFIVYSCFHLLKCLKTENNEEKTFRDKYLEIPLSHLIYELEIKKTLIGR